MLAVSHTDLGGNLDILASFRDTQGLLFDVIDYPEEVDRLVRQVTRSLAALLRRTGCDHSPGLPRNELLDADLVDRQDLHAAVRFFLYDLAARCSSALSCPTWRPAARISIHGFYHLDGKGEIPHLDLLLGIQRLRGIQWIPGDGQPTPDQWLPLLKRIRDGGKLCQVFVSPAGARRIVRELGGKGFLFVVNSWEGEISTSEEAEAFLETLAEEDK